jgi:hypothetical protein
MMKRYLFSETGSANVRPHFRISGGGAPDNCWLESLLIWNGNLYRDEKDRLIADLVFSFKNFDFRRAIFYDTLALDLTSVNAETDESVYLKIEGYPGLVAYHKNK